MTMLWALLSGGLALWFLWPIGVALCEALSPRARQARRETARAARAAWRAAQAAQAAQAAAFLTQYPDTRRYITHTRAIGVLGRVLEGSSWFGLCFSPIPGLIGMAAGALLIVWSWRRSAHLARIWGWDVRARPSPPRGRASAAPG
jgi:hypothetical protein